jgi:hypothetical protein
MGNMHQLLAVEPDLAGTYKAITNETIKTFGKREHFFGSEKKLEMFEEGVDSTFPVEHKKMDTTVNEKLDYQESAIIKYFDAVLQKDLTNCEAKADLVVDGKVIAEQVPATFLLGLETKLKQVIRIYSTIPTLQPGVEWEIDPNLGEDVYRRKRPEESAKTETTFKAVILYEAQFPKEGEKGESLPAQVEKVPDKRDIGMYTKQVWTGMLSPATKSKLLGRLYRLLEGAKSARSKANENEIVSKEIGRSLFDFIHERDKFK